MVIEGDVGETRRRLFAIRRGLARPRFLVSAHKEPCSRCGSHTRTVTVWSTPAGTMERIAWCRYCFEAECGIVRPSSSELEELARTMQAMDQDTPVTWFDCARQATDELERCGIL